MAPKRKIPTPLTPPPSHSGSVATIASSSRRSSRAIPKKNYAQGDLLNDPDVYDDPLDREASPDQSSELSAPPSEVDEHSDVLSEDDALSEATVEATPKPKKKNATPRSKPQQKAPSKKQSPVKSPGPATQGATPDVEPDESYDSDNDIEDEKPQTKASKFRERDARAAEKYAEFEAREPTFDSDYVPVPFKGRLGYACLNTILRSRKEPVFCSRTTRIATIAKEDKGMPFVLELGRQNAADLAKMLEWNEKYGIRFFRISSEMFPFASHPDYLYNLEHADAELKAAGAVANKFDHRITCHPGQFTQIASPNPKIFDNAVRDLEFHNELLTRLNLQPEQRNRDAVMILHLGGAYGDKPATLERFRTNYARLSPEVRQRLVLENDDMSWSVSDLLPLCQELNIPLVLDWHHHNIVRDEEKFREGSLDILPILPAIAETWSKKGIKQKMHISEARLPNHPLPSKRRSHSARVYHLPPCADDMDIMIEAKDKEQAVFELSKAYGLNNPPIPPEVVGDGPGAKDDEAYWPEGEELRLKTTKTRVKKEPEYDSEGNEIKPVPKPKKRVKKEAVDSKVKDEEVEEQEQIKADLHGNMPPPTVPESTKKRRSRGGTTAVKEEEQEETIEHRPYVQKPKKAARATKTKAVKKEEAEGEIPAVNNAEESPPLKKRRSTRNSAASQTELDTGISAKALVDEAVERLEAAQHLHGKNPTAK
ncbi:UV-damage endonuclease [Taphrina deformans PYCC 5710]|uniref:UV-damage endonuclease n=1 Tax=Taphrina deformans (strain PYCC 5710 / ATCC 11124 / CBS 356.35 / IMI 108563 / JCM 9778 / NBRC 8474) TaxID=1097556 RepID=R4ZYL9_TAPDE|nr:UV-damage endonuclease [Taphrina deformans PYCC 5710]|eukprot:CCX35426.1 UV-damage endonuclease [Taphrina deformans PYCC 5710]